MLDAAEAVTGVRPPAVPRITWHQAMDTYGTDKPDLRFGMELVELTDIFAATGFKAFATAGSHQGDPGPGSRPRLGPQQARRPHRPRQVAGGQGPGVAEGGGRRVVRVAGGQVPVGRREPGAGERLEAKPEDLLLLVADEWATTCEVLGDLRNTLGRPPVAEGPYRYLWVVDFPLFVGADETTGKLKTGHHPFCHPHTEDIAKLETDPLSVRAWAYDLVLNGWELGSGSIRIHDPVLQQRVFTQLGIDEEEAQARFGFFLNPFRYGAPPHGGFAYGLDRLVAILAGEENIREVIAFPKPQSGGDPMTGAPLSIEDRQLNELGLRLLPPAT